MSSLFSKPSALFGETHPIVCWGLRKVIESGTQQVHHDSGLFVYEYVGLSPKDWQESFYFRSLVIDWKRIWFEEKKRANHLISYDLYEIHIRRRRNYEGASYLGKKKTGKLKKKRLVENDSLWTLWLNCQNAVCALRSTFGECVVWLVPFRLNWRRLAAAVSSMIKKCKKM